MMAKTQKTPKGEPIPIPKRKDFMRDLLKAANPKPRKKSRRRTSK